METITKPLTLQIVIPNIEVVGVTILNEKLSVQFGTPKTPRPVSASTVNAIEKTLADDVLDVVEQMVDAYSRSWRQLPDSALEEFWYLDRPQDFAAFIQKHGPFTAFDPAKDAVGHAPRSVGLSFPWKAIKLEAGRMQKLLRLKDEMQFMEEGDVVSLEEAVNEASSLGFHFTTQDTQRQLAIYLSRALSIKAKVGIAYDDSFGFIPRLYCADLLTGLYALLFKSLIDQSPFATCVRSSCGKLFKRTIPSKKHCSNSCRQAEAQKRYRNSLPKRKHPRKSR